MQFRFPLITVVLALTAAGQTNSPPSNVLDSQTTIRTETRVVLVDTVVTDKKGQYVHGLAQKNFKVWEDGKEQQISSFSFEADPASPSYSQRHYIVLFFDNSSASASNQSYARKAASQFLAANAGPNRVFAVAEYDGTLRITQNFTDDKIQLERAVAGIKIALQSYSGFGSRIMLDGLRDLAKRLSSVPGRKTLVLLSGGFPITTETHTWLTAAIDACNRANIAVYPIDVRGLIAATGSTGQRSRSGLFSGMFDGVSNALASFSSVSTVPSEAFLQGRGGSSPGSPTGGSGGGRPVSSPSPSPTRSPAPSTARTGGTSAPNMIRSPVGLVQPPRTLIPPINPHIVGNQQGLYALAEGTGGFVIVNSNDLLGGLDKIGKEQNEFYLLGYTPSKEPEPGACHTLKVKVDKGGAEVRARTGYCEARPLDMLKGTDAVRQLETRIQSNAAPTVAGASMQMSFFYGSADTCRVDVAMDLPASALKFNKGKGKFHSSTNVVGIAYRTDGGVAARFSDTINLELEDKKAVEAFEDHPYHYEKQFEITPGTYSLKVAFASSPQLFGKVEAPMSIAAYDGKAFALSGIAFSKQVNKLGSADTTEQALIEDLVPLIAGQYQVVPAGSNHFHASEPAFVYAEAYTPDAQAGATAGADMKIIDRKTNQVKLDSGMGRVGSAAQAANAMVPIALRMPLDKIGPGSYTVEITAADAAGHSATRRADFEVDQ